MQTLEVGSMIDEKRASGERMDVERRKREPRESGNGGKTRPVTRGS